MQEEGRRKQAIDSALKDPEGALPARTPSAERGQRQQARAQIEDPMLLVHPRRGVPTTGRLPRAVFLRNPLGSRAIQGGQVLLLRGLGERRRNGWRSDERSDLFAALCSPRAATILAARAVPAPSPPALSSPPPSSPASSPLFPDAAHRRCCSSAPLPASRWCRWMLLLPVAARRSWTWSREAASQAFWRCG